MRFNVRSALLIAIMVASGIAAISEAGRRFSPGWSGSPLAAACFLVALEAGFIHYVARREHMAFGELARYAVPELFAMAAIMRVAATFSAQPSALGTDLERWLYDPLSIFEPLFVLYLLIGLIVAALTHLMMRDLAALAPPPYETTAPPPESDERLAVLMAEDRAAALRRVGQRFVVGGVLLLIALGVEAVNIEQPGGPALPISAVSALSTLTYIVCGFVLFSQARLALLHTRWRLDAAHVAEGLTQRWNRASLLLIAGVTLSAALLPRSYGQGLLALLSDGLAFVGYAAAVLGYLVMSLFGLLLALPAWLLSLLLPPEPNAPPPPPPPPPELPPAPPQFEREPNLLAVVVFWICILALLVYAVRIIARRHPGLGKMILSLGPLAALLGWLGALWRDSAAWTGMAAESLRARVSRPVAMPPPPPPPPRFDQLSPREQVRFAYRATLDHAAAQGLGRRVGQTPYEYEAALTPDAPAAREDMTELTEAFVRARYSPETVSPEAARSARAHWERLRRTLRKHREGS